MGTSQTFAPDVPVTTVDVMGTPVALRRKGEGAPLLFLHGGGFTGRWLRFHEALSAKADLIAPEHPGWGDTPMQDWLDEVEDLAIHYDELRRVLGLERVDLVGYSVGGWTAAVYASLYPDNVSSLTLIAAAGMPLPPGVETPDLFLLGPDEIGPALFHDPTNAGEVMADPDDWDALQKSLDELTTLARLMWHRRWDRKLPHRLQRVDCPTLVLAAEHDAISPMARNEAYAEAIAGARLERLPDVGHALIIEQPEAVAQQIHAFLEDVR
jgi:pimeloyl-ACP methyl ester carboxylesterase